MSMKGMGFLNLNLTPTTSVDPTHSPTATMTVSQSILYQAGDASI